MNQRNQNDDFAGMVYIQDCIDMSAIPDCSVHSLVTDPPAGIGFMNKEWDGDRGGRNRWIAWMSERMKEAHRVLKPGAYGFVWAIPRTSHWTAFALEEAGFEIKDVVTHHYATGFPKSVDISKAIDKHAGAERRVIGRYTPPSGNAWNLKQADNPELAGSPGSFTASGVRTLDITAPATPEAELWDGWGTALKPASEHWILVRKPISQGIVQNVLTHGTGALNIGASRISLTGDPKADAELRERDHLLGRWPTNAIFSHSDACRLIGHLSGSSLQQEEPAAPVAISLFGEDVQIAQPERRLTPEVPVYDCVAECPVAKLDQQGSRDVQSSQDQVDQAVDPMEGISKFFFVPKPPRAEKPGTRKNGHPTVKPLALMQYLVRLVTPGNGIVLDPFAGSGTTLQAAESLGFRWVGYETCAEYAPLIRERLAQQALF